MFVASKYLRCESLYQLMAMCIACWFKLRSSDDVYQQKIGGEQPQQKTKVRFASNKEVQEAFPYLIDDTQRRRCEL